jgi:hypothetical protein
MAAKTPALDYVLAKRPPENSNTSESAAAPTEASDEARARGPAPVDTQTMGPSNDRPVIINQAAFSPPEPKPEADNRPTTYYAPDPPIGTTERLPSVESTGPVEPGAPAGTSASGAQGQ